jgi:hypothetical protein
VRGQIALGQPRAKPNGLGQLIDFLLDVPRIEERLEDRKPARGRRAVGRLRFG